MGFGSGSVAVHVGPYSFASTSEATSTEFASTSEALSTEFASTSEAV